MRTAKSPGQWQPRTAVSAAEDQNNLGTKARLCLVRVEEMPPQGSKWDFLPHLHLHLHLSPGAPLAHRAFLPQISRNCSNSVLELPRAGGPVRVGLCRESATLKQLDVDKATGSNGIPVHLLKETADQIIPSLTMLFNKSLRLGIFPKAWKLANIVSILKKGKGDRGELSPYLHLPVITKVLERCLLGLRHYISHFISREQHGFLAGRSCATQLTSVLHYIGGQLNAGKQIHMVYLDMSKAFGKVDHTKLLGRLHQYGITGKLHDWFSSYLPGRKQQVTVPGVTSRELPVTSGVPQGSL